MEALFVGMMSGTSLDGVDAVLAAFDSHGELTVRAEHALPYPADIRAEVLALQQTGNDELRRAARLANKLADLYARAVNALLAQNGVRADQVRAIGCHGQTIRHAPQDGYTLQIGNLARLAEQTGIDVIGDFRSRDVAAGGHGAPLVPAFHRAVFAHPERARVIVNIGGISNLTLLIPGHPVSGFDCGPGNMLMDAWCRRHIGQPFDRDGRWAATGQIDAALLAALLAEPFFAAAPPKSTGRDLFDLHWLDRLLAPFAPLAPQDVQATLLALTAASIADAIARHADAAQEVFLCGGGAFNHTLVAALGARLAGRHLNQTAALGLPPQQVEAAAFAWLARQCLAHEPGNLPEATGAAGPRVLGAIYPR
ncbi:MAG: anhydro-N-acetylmuramic acid kinase [Paludibacterium sp.]|uniref:anhydro-N-acetylmuramic acid kinase n=1 Tax=Paludibacterium sp. TaxID=1917523 RepID=UPI0025DB05AA|nr:anhydro-N-acetylmuramic acid kinase [Paludibacterium sp.]MBV8049416.1 anhydro-N-acetylmuramic acid kinase [Paludibacterium sp.]MBV8645795.1 anhydro-N-acetylmuramic acid kinase [Paludibacterium sp.]